MTCEEVSQRARAIYSVFAYNCFHCEEGKPPYTGDYDMFIECVKAAAISSSLEKIADSLNEIKNTLDRIAPKE